jgi:type VII secretion effector (TIGR04197 family)
MKKWRVFYMGAIGTIQGIASAMSTNIKNGAENLSGNSVRTITGGNVNAISDGNGAVSELLQLFQEAGAIITRDAGKIMEIDGIISGVDADAARAMDY